MRKRHIEPLNMNDYRLFRRVAFLDLWGGFSHLTTSERDWQPFVGRSVVSEMIVILKIS